MSTRMAVDPSLFYRGPDPKNGAYAGQAFGAGIEAFGAGIGAHLERRRKMAEAGYVSKDDFDKWEAEQRQKAIGGVGEALGQFKPHMAVTPTTAPEAVPTEENATFSNRPVLGSSPDRSMAGPQELMHVPRNGPTFAPQWQDEGFRDRNQRNPDPGMTPPPMRQAPMPGQPNNVNALASGVMRGGSLGRAGWNEQVPGGTAPPPVPQERFDNSALGSALQDRGITEAMLSEGASAPRQRGGIFGGGSRLVKGGPLMEQMAQYKQLVAAGRDPAEALAAVKSPETLRHMGGEEVTGASKFNSTLDYRAAIYGTDERARTEALNRLSRDYNAGYEEAGREVRSIRESGDKRLQRLLEESMNNADNAQSGENTKALVGARVARSREEARLTTLLRTAQDNVNRFKAYQQVPENAEYQAAVKKRDSLQTQLEELPLDPTWTPPA